jgi:hypothetical protein
LLPESQAIVSKEVRAARATLFDEKLSVSVFDVPHVPFGASPAPLGTVVRVRPLPELPLEASDGVVVGEVTAAQPFPSASRSVLYTEYSVRVLDVVKGKINANQSITILRRGGTARLDDGRVIEWRVYGEGDPMQVGNQYLLFLGYLPEAEAFGVHKMWHVKDRLLKAAFPAERGMASKFQSQVDGKFVSEVIALLKSSQNQ